MTRLLNRVERNLHRWLQEQHAMAFIGVKSSLGIRYFDHLVSVLGSLPGLSFYVAAPGLSERIDVTPGLGAAWMKSIYAFSSVLVFGAVLGFSQRARVLRRMIERLLLQPVGAPIEMLLRLRLLRAPSIVKRELRDAFLAEADDARKLRPLEIALKKRSFTAPIYFLQAFSQLSPIVRDKGATMCAAFVERGSGRIYLRTHCEILQTCCTEFHAGALQGQADLRRAAAIALPCMEHLLNAAPADEAVLQLLRQPTLRTMLGSLVHQPGASGLATRAASFLRTTPANAATAPSLRQL